MKNLFLLLFLINTSLICFSQNNTPNWKWAKAVGGSDDEFATSVTTDLNGNVIVTGYYESLSMSIGATTLFGNGSYEIFIVKYDPYGNILWAKSANGASLDYPNDITSDINGNIYIVGNSNSPSITFGSTTLSSSGGFIAKYDASGNIIWAKSINGSVNGVITGTNGDTYIAGGFSDSTIVFGATTLINNGSTDIFLAKYDALGNEVWAKSSGGTSAEYANKISIDQNNNIYLTGEFLGQTLMIGSSLLTNTSSSRDIFITKYSATSNNLWAKSFGSSDQDYVYNITSDANGNTCIVGDFYYQSLYVGTTTLQNMGKSDVFIVNYDSLGGLIWAKSGGGTHFDYIRGVTSDGNGNTFVTGYFSSSVINFDTTSLNPVDYYDVYVVKYNISGNVDWIKSSTAMSGGDISIDNFGNLYIAGAFRDDSCSFDSINLANTAMNWMADAFISKLGNNPLSVSNNFNEKGEILTVYPNPFNNKLTLNYTSINKTTRLEVYNLVGKKIISQSLEQQNTVFDLSKESNGIYLITITDGNNRVSKKVIKQ